MTFNVCQHQPVLLHNAMVSHDYACHHCSMLHINICTCLCNKEQLGAKFPVCISLMACKEIQASHTWKGSGMPILPTSTDPESGKAQRQ